MKEIVVGIWLGIQAYWDFKYKEIPLWFSILGAAAGLVFCIYEERTVISVLYACIPGFVALVFSWMTKEVMGYGDGIVMLVLGSFMPLKQLLSVGLIAFSLAGAVALVLLVIFHKRGNYKMAFIPFLAVAYGVDYLIRMGEAIG